MGTQRRKLRAKKKARFFFIFRVLFFALSPNLLNAWKRLYDWTARLCIERSGFESRPGTLCCVLFLSKTFFALIAPLSTQKYETGEGRAQCYNCIINSKLVSEGQELRREKGQLICSILPPKKTMMTFQQVILL